MTSIPLPAGRLLAGPGLTAVVIPGRSELRLRGEADASNVAVLREAMRALPLFATRIQLALAGLNFIDLASTRQLVILTCRPGRPEVILHYPPPHLVLLISTLWPAALPQFSTQERRSAPAASVQGPAHRIHRRRSGSRHCSWDERGVHLAH